MPTKSSRYLHQDKLAVTDEKGRTRLVYEQRDTTVFASELPTGTRVVTVEPSDTMYDTARKHLGRRGLWWILADMNPDTAFYPLDLRDADELNVPPKSNAARFTRR